MDALRSVLLVEDTEADRYLATRVLRKAWPDVEVLEAGNGEEAIESLNERLALDGPMPDLILLDVNMPRMNGFEFLEAWYAERGFDIPVVAMLSSSGQAADRERAARFDCVRGYIVKPIDRETAARLPRMLGAAEG